MIRPVLVLLHRYVGLATAIFLVVIGLTGSLLAYLQPLSAWLAPELHAAPGRGAALSPFELARRVRAAEPRAEVTGWPLDLVPGRGVRFWVKPRAATPAAPGTSSPPLGFDQLWADPVTGAVLGRVDTTALPPTRQSLMDFVYALHENLALPGNWGTWIVGLVALLWFFDCFVGAALTFPRGRPFFHKWRPAWGVKPRRLNYDLHRAGGLWPWLLLATLALSGVYFNLAQPVFFPVFDLVATRTVDPTDSRPERTGADAPPATVSPEQALATARATANAHGWRGTASFMARREAQGLWQVYYDKAPAQWATAGNYGVLVDDRSGAVVHLRQPGFAPGDVFLDWLSALHVGSVFGWPYKLVLCALGLAIAGLSGTGLVIWWRKLRARRAGRRRRRERLLAVSGVPAG